MNRAIAFLAAMLLLSPASMALVNPNFTPRHLVDQSDLVVAGTVQKGDKPTEWKISVTETIRGAAVKEIVLDLSKCEKKFAAGIAKTFADNANQPIIFYSRKVAGREQAYVHVAGIWLKVEADKQGQRFVTGYAPEMVGTFMGGTDKLIAMTRHLVAQPGQGVPVAAGIGWLAHAKCGPVKGDVAGLASVEIGGRKGVCLFVGADGGDRLLAAKGDEDMEDITAKAKLDTKSKRFTWVDLNGDGLGDLISFDGQFVFVRFNSKEGVFTDAGAEFAHALQAQCLGLAPCSANDGKPGVLVSTNLTPLLLTAGEKGWTLVKLPDAPPEVGNLGQPSACIVADLDRDGCADILQPGVQGSLLWKGKPGGFAEPVKSSVATGQGPVRAAVADFDEDGLLDIFLAGSVRNGLWENDGKGDFKDVFAFCGSLSYKCPTGAADAQAMDLNHDGRADICVVYERSEILYSWNRGFRTFAESGEVRLSGLPNVHGAPRVGQKALGVGDFNGDWSLDLAVVLTTGELQVYFNDKMSMSGINFHLPKGMVGPVTAACTLGEKSPFHTGVAAVYGSSPPACQTIRIPGTVTVKYRYPGKKEQTIQIKVGDKAEDVVLENK